MRKFIKPVIAGMAAVGLFAMACVANVGDGSFDDNSFVQVKSDGSFDDNSYAQKDGNYTTIDDEATALFACVDNEDGDEVVIDEEEVPL